MRKITVWLLVLSLSMGSTLDVCRAQTVLSISGKVTQSGGGGSSNSWISTIMGTIKYTFGGGGNGGGTPVTINIPNFKGSGESCVTAANNAIFNLTTYVNGEIIALNLTQAQQQSLASTEQQTIDAYLKQCE